MEVKVLGTGCPKCGKLYDRAVDAVAESGVQAEIQKVEKLADIIDYGVMMTPALVIDTKVMSSGHIPAVADIVQWLKAAGGA